MTPTQTVERTLGKAEIEKINEVVQSYGKEVDENTRILTARIEDGDHALLKYPSSDNSYSIRGPDAAENFDSSGIYPELEQEYENPVFFNHEEARELNEESNILIGEHGQVRDQDPEGWNIINRRLERAQCYLTAKRDVIKLVKFEDEDLLLSLEGEEYRL